MVIAVAQFSTNNSISVFSFLLRYPFQKGSSLSFATMTGTTFRQKGIVSPRRKVNFFRRSWGGTAGCPIETVPLLGFTLA